MKPYDSYKDSEAKWVGKIPSSWKRVRIKYLLSRSSAGVWGDDEKGDANDIACFRVADFDYEHGCLSFDKLTYRNIAPKQLEGRTLSEGDLLIEKSGGGEATPVGRVVRYNFDDYATCSNFVHSVSVNKDCDSDYLYYYFFAMYANKENLLYFNQTTGIQNLKVGEYLSQTIFLPNLAEQQAIATYLEKKCKEIDKAIITQQKRIELLQELRQNIITHAVTRGINPDAPLKDSGVEWIGMVPEHWEIKRIKHCANIFGRIGFRGYTTEDLVSEGEGPITLSPSNMQGKMNYDSCSYLSWYKYNESPEIQIYNGDVLFVKTGSTYGKSAYVENLPMEATINPQIVVFKDFNNCNSKFFYYMLTTHVVQNQVDNTVIGSTIPTIGQEKIRNYVLPIPPFNEQQAIVACIESETAKLDKQVVKANRQISLLQELKQSIITEVVTGKRKVC